MDGNRKTEDIRKTDRRTIVIVEDDEDLAQVTSATLSKAGFECVIVNDGSEALRTVKEVRPDLVILDVMMPQVSGYEVCRSIRKDSLVYGSPILMISALREESAISLALEQGADDYLVKPFDLGELLNRVKMLLETHAGNPGTTSITGLPGLEILGREIDSKLFRNERIAVGYLELDNFRYYREAYGPEKGDGLIKQVARILQETKRDQGIREFSLGHIGGASFIFMLSTNDYREYCKEIISRFERQQQTFYTKEDFDRGFMLTNNGANGPDGDKRASLVRMAVGVVTNEFHHFPNVARLDRMLMQVNQEAKGREGNNVFVAPGCWCCGTEVRL